MYEWIKYFLPRVSQMRKCLFHFPSRSCKESGMEVSLGNVTIVLEHEESN